MKTPVLEVKMTKKKGMGVFATKFIREGEIIETCYCIKLDKPGEELGILSNYVYHYPAEGEYQFSCAPLGCGMIYNHDDNANAYWRDSKLELHFDFIALRDIKKGEEICTNYGKNYWKNRPEITKKYKTNNIWEHINK